MKFVRECVLLLLLAAGHRAPRPALATPTCTGRFANPITDICWRCMLPIRFGGLDLLSMGQEDTPNPGGSPLCACPVAVAGRFQGEFLGAGEASRCGASPVLPDQSRRTRTDPGFDAPRGSRFSQDSTSTSSFYQVHWYVDPVIFWLEAIFDNACLEQGGFDVAYLTELDPMWHDDELTFILNPEVALFGNLAARAACAADCAAATAGFPLNTLFWCAGCQGSLYPLNGNVQAHIGGVQASSLEMTRLIAKMHREGLMWAASGEDGLCGYYPQPIMDKTGYKYHMLYPIPQTAQIAGKCCQPLGRSTILWGAGREFPFEGEDFAYMVFRKRNCCQGAF
jgi:conjugal transfer pilus assembly protein TraU